jgi:hypothetical protein
MAHGAEVNAETFELEGGRTFNCGATTGISKRRSSGNLAGNTKSQ